MKLKSGCQGPFPERIHEGYKIVNDQIIANVGVDKIESIMQHFIVVHDEPLFFILELPAQEQDEQEIRQGVLDGLHRDVYYLDGCSREKALAILMRTGSLLYEDGLAVFGFGGHTSGDEILFGKYNVLTIISDNLDVYSDFFAAHDLKEDPDLITAWDTFDPQHPGISERVIVDGRDVYSLPEQLRDWGLTWAERRAENPK